MDQTRLQENRPAIASLVAHLNTTGFTNANFERTMRGRIGQRLNGKMNLKLIYRGQHFLGSKPQQVPDRKH